MGEKKELTGPEAITELARVKGVPADWLEAQLKRRSTNPSAGISKSAYKRWLESSRGRLLISGKAGQTVQLSDRQYVIAKDGSFRNVKVEVEVEADPEYQKREAA